jgi:hypothetical protein
MFAYPLRTAALAVAAAVGLSACTTGYGYNGVSVGVSSGYYDPYYSGYGYGGYGYGYPRYGYGYGYGINPYWGWYDGFYYPGTGFYIYDRYRRKHRWSDHHRRYWTDRRERAVRSSTTTQPVVIRENWGDFSRDRRTIRRETTQGSVGNPARVERVNRSVRAERPARVERSPRATASERASARSERRSQSRSERGSRGSRGSRDD